jgi:hypothetical protein
MCVYRWVFHEIYADKTYFRRTHNLPWFNFIADFWSPLSPPTNSTIVDGSKHQTKHYQKKHRKLNSQVAWCSFIMFYHVSPCRHTQTIKWWCFKKNTARFPGPRPPGRILSANFQSVLLGHLGCGAETRGNVGPRGNVPVRRNGVFLKLLLFMCFRINVNVLYIYIYSKWFLYIHIGAWCCLMIVCAWHFLWNLGCWKVFLGVRWRMAWLCIPLVLLAFSLTNLDIGRSSASPTRNQVEKLFE